MGRPAVPTRKKVQRGTFQASRSPEREAVPARAVPEKPAFLTPDASKEWDRIAPELESVGLLSRVDAAGLTAYCEAWSDYCWARRQIRKARIVRSKNGEKCLNPAFKVQKEATSILIRCITEFGLGPASRSRIEALPPKSEDEAVAQHFAA